MSRVERETVERAQTIVSDFLVSDLSKVVDLLGQHAFNDPQRRYYVIIDDLDKDWMPNSEMYLGLIKGLLATVRDLNRRLPGGKIIVALRDDVFARIIASSGTVEPQREKWLDVALQVRWTETELVEFVNKRLAVMARSEFTKDPPTFSDLLPQGKARRWGNPENYILDRTLLRPRDLLDFLNTCVKSEGAFQTLTWGSIRKAEIVYSERRLTALYDEWASTYGHLKCLVDQVKSLGKRWELASLDGDRIDGVLTAPDAQSSVWLKNLGVRRMAGHSLAQIQVEIARVLIEIGLVTVREPNTHRVIDPADVLAGIPEVHIRTGSFSFHRMFWAALGLHEEQTSALGQGDSS